MYKYMMYKTIIACWIPFVAQLKCLWKADTFKSVQNALSKVYMSRIITKQIFSLLHNTPAII